jgi:hypothetical protein
LDGPPGACKWHPGGLSFISGCRPAVWLYIPPDIMTRQQVLDLYFLDARHKLVEIAAFLDRAERAAGRDDFRLRAFREALTELSTARRQKTRRVLLKFSDPSAKPVAKAETKGACGAWNRR